MSQSGCQSGPVNAAIFCERKETAFLTAALRSLGSNWMLISDDAALLPGIAAGMRIAPAEAGIDPAMFDVNLTVERILPHIARAGQSVLVIDMAWQLAMVSGPSRPGVWGSAADRIAEQTGVAVVSLYGKAQLVEEQIEAALRAHRQFLAPSGLYTNPFWLPEGLMRDGTRDEILSFMLGRVVPDYARDAFNAGVERQAARGASPDWIAAASLPGLPAGQSARWHIQCLGPLAVHTGGSEPVDWQIPGSAPLKTRTLFAYLLQSGAKGVHSERIGELLWPQDIAEATKRTRLHHTIAMLRKSLGGQQTVIRSGDFYRLNVPSGSTLDITVFEQLCRRAISLARQGQSAAALPLYYAAEKLYRGDLFEDLPLAYIQPEHEDWCMPRRIWLREMALRVQYDMSAVLRAEGRANEALEHVQRALAYDPTNEAANIEALRVFSAQDRLPALHRHYKQFRAACAALGVEPGGGEIDEVYAALGRAAPQRKTKARDLG